MYIYIIYIYIYIFSSRHSGAIYKLDCEGIQCNMTDTTSFMLTNLQSIFLPTKTKISKVIQKYIQ